MRVRKYNKGGEIDSLLNYIKNTNKPVPAQSDATRVAAPAPPVNTTDRDVFEVNRMFERMTALEGEQKKSGLPPDMYTGRVQTDLGAAAMTPIGDIADIAGGVTNFAEAKGVAQKALAAGEIGAAMALVLAPVNLDMLKQATKGLRREGKELTANYLETIADRGGNVFEDVRTADEMGLGADDVQDVIDELGFLADDIEYRNNLSDHPDSDNVRDLIDRFETKLYGPTETVNMQDLNLKQEIGSYKAVVNRDDFVKWADDKGNVVSLGLEESFNPATKRTENVFSIDAIAYMGGDTSSPSRVFVEAINAVPVGSTVFSSSMSADSYPIFLKFLSGRRGRTPKAEVNTEFPIVYGSLNSLGGKAQQGKLTSGGVDSFFGLTDKEISMIGNETRDKDSLLKIKEAVDKKLKEAGLPESKISERAYSGVENWYSLQVPYPHVTRTAEGFKYGGFLRIKKKKDKNKKFNIKRFK